MMKTIDIITEKKASPPPPVQVRGGNPYEKTVRQFSENRNELNRRFLNHEESDDPETVSDLLDDYFRTSFGQSESGFKLDLIANPYAIAATGSYGRKEVSRTPDVSILFVFKDSIPPGAAGLIRDIVYPLWDLGFTVNYSTKTVKDCITTASRDFGTLSALIDSRFICGVSPLYSRLMGQLREKIVFSRKREILAYLVDRDRARHLKYHGPGFLLEPDLVFSPGGLKDYHSVMSSARIALNLIEPREIETQGLISEGEFRILNESLAFLRNTLRFIHLSGDKPQSRLLLKHQHRAARFLGYENDRGRNAVDLFLRDVFRHMDRIRIIARRFFLGLVPEKSVSENSLENDVKTGTKWVKLSKGMVTVTSSVKLKKHPELLLGVFRESLNHQAPLSPETLRLVEEFRFLADDSFSGNPVMAGLFENLLLMSPVSSDIPEVLRETGILSAFVPVFEACEHDVRFEVHPRYPLDLHHLWTLHHLKVLLENHGVRVPVLSDTARLSVLWAGLLHDMGTGSSHHERPGAETIMAILKRFHSDEAFSESVLALIEHHRRLMRLVSDEDMADRNVITGFAEHLENPEMLTLLYYLSLADLRAGGGCTVNDFIEEDLSFLCETGMSVLAGHGHFSSAAWDPDSLEKIRAMERRGNGGSCLHVLEHGNTRTATLIYPLGPECLCGVLSAFRVHNMDVYDMRVIEDTDSRTFLVMRVTPPRDRMFEKQKWRELEKELDDFFSGTASPDGDGPGVANDDDYGSLPHHAKIKIFNPMDVMGTRIEINGRDSALLLCRITRIVGGMGYRIVFMRKGYHRNGSRFLFLVRDSGGNRLTSDKKCQLKAVIDDACNR